MSLNAAWTKGRGIVENEQIVIEIIEFRRNTNAQQRTYCGCGVGGIEEGLVAGQLVFVKIT